MDLRSVKLSARTVTGKKVNRLRRRGIVPVHVYGTGTNSVVAQVEEQTLNRLLPEIGSNIPVSVEVDGQDNPDICFVREVQRHPVTESLVHVDFLRLDVTQTVSADVPIILEGIAPGVTQMGGVLLQNLQSIRVEALPMEMPANFRVDITNLVDFEITTQIRDIEIPDNIAILNDPKALVVRVTAPRIEIIETEELEGEEGIEDGLEGEEVDAADGEHPS